MDRNHSYIVEKLRDAADVTSAPRYSKERDRWFRYYFCRVGRHEYTEQEQVAYDKIEKTIDAISSSDKSGWAEVKDLTLGLMRSVDRSR